MSLWERLGKEGWGQNERNCSIIGNKLSGSLPPEIILLKQSLVTLLKVRNNDLVNYGKEGNAFLGQLTALEHLSVGQTYFENDGILTEIGLLTNLVTYEADSNSYDGPLIAIWNSPHCTLSTAFVVPAVFNKERLCYRCACVPTLCNYKDGRNSPVNVNISTN